MLPLLISLIGLTACSGVGGAAADDTATASLDDFPPFPTVNHVTIRSGGVDTTVDCGLDNSMVSLEDTPDGFEDPHLFALQCMSSDSGPEAIRGFGLYAAGTFAAGSSTNVAVEPDRAGQDDTLSVALATRGSGWSITLDGDGGTLFSGVVHLDAVGSAGESIAGTFRASWDLVLTDTDGDGSGELVERPSALSCAFDLPRQ